MDSASALAGIPTELRKELRSALEQTARNFRERRWEPSELNGGKLCEVAYSVLRGHVDGKFPKKATKPRNMVDACKALESADATVFPRSVRIQIPRLLVALYEIRNNRGVGHVGGDVDPNHMDATVVLQCSKWIVAELVRVFHQVDTAEATRVVDDLVQKTVPVVWEVSDARRVLTPGLSMKDQTLLLLYSVGGSVPEKQLLSWVEHSNPSVYRRDVLRRCHRERLVEYNQQRGEVQLSPTGIAHVEQNLALDF